MRQGAVQMTRPDTTESFNRFTSGIRVKSLNQMLLLALWTRRQFDDHTGSLYQTFLQRAKAGNLDTDHFSSFVDGLHPDVIAAALACRPRKAWEYLEALKKLLAVCS